MSALVEVITLCSNPSPSLKRVLELDLGRLPPEATPVAAPVPTKQKVHLTAVQLEAIAMSYLAGATTHELAAEYGVTYTTISRRLKEQGVRVRNNVLSEDEITAALVLYQYGHSLDTVAKRMGRAPNSIRNALLKRGVRVRDFRGM